MNLIKSLSPRHTLWTFIPILVVLAFAIGLTFKNLNAFAVVGIAVVVALPINKVVADAILRRIMRPK